MSAAIKKGQAGANSIGPGMTKFIGLPAYSTAPENLLLARLENVKQYGQGWRAKCPAHDGKSNSSLAIITNETGAVILHCFGGCDALAVVHAVGLEMSDLFPKRETKDMTPTERRQLRQLAKQSQWAAALNVLNLEARIVAVAGDQISQAEPLSDSDRERLGLALERITGARLVLSGR